MTAKNATSGARQLASSRQQEILTRLGATGSVSVSELSGLLGVSRETIRRDFKFLAEQGRLDIVHGGAARRAVAEPALAQRVEENAGGKAAIGRLAASLVEDGMVVLLDSGTTTLSVARALAVAGRSLTVCTSGIAAAQLLCRVSGIRVHMLGGEVDGDEEAVVGIDVIEAISRFRVDIAFVGVGGVSDAGEVTDYSRLGAEQRGRMIGAARRSYFVVDRTKFGRLTPVRISGFDAAAGLITDAPVPARAGAVLESQGIRIIVAH